MTVAPTPVLMLILLLASSVSVIAGDENPCDEKCVQSCNKEIDDAYRQSTCEEEEEEREQKREREGPWQPGGESEREEGSGSESRRQNYNPFLFKSKSNRFQTLFKNELGSIRLLRRFDHYQRSDQYWTLGNIRIAEFTLKPNTLLIPHHADSQYMLVVLTGRALVSVLYPNERYSYKLERGDAIRIPMGNSFYLINPDNNQHLRAVAFAKSGHGPGQIREFTPSNNQYRQSYFRGFTRNLLEASFNTDFEEIQRTLLGEEERKQEGFIVSVSKEHISELSKHAKSSSTSLKHKSSSQLGPFNVRSADPIYSNNFGSFFEVTLKKDPHFRHFDLFLSSVDINQGALLLPHYNSRATAIVIVEEGRGEFQLAVPSELDDVEEEDDNESSREVRSYRGRLSEGDVVLIPAGHPVAFNASSDLRLFAFGVHGHNSHRIFLAGERDNVINQIHTQVKDLTFPGDVDTLIKNQRESHFVNARHQHQPIVGAFY